jgi:hypothetical protein
MALHAAMIAQKSRGRPSGRPLLFV